MAFTRHWLNDLIAAAGHNAESLAHEIGVAPFTVYRWKAGEMTPGKVNRQKLATAFGVPVDLLDERLDGETHVGVSETACSVCAARSRLKLSHVEARLDTSSVLRDLSALLTAGPDGRARRARDGDLAIDRIRQLVRVAKVDYQACRHMAAARQLPNIVCLLEAAREQANGDAKLLFCALTASTYQLATSILLRLGSNGLAILGANRSVEFARCSESAIVIGSSARAMTHALARTGDSPAATQLACDTAAWMDACPDRATPERLSVQGSLILRGATAAAAGNDADTARTLLDEADGIARRMGEDREDHNHHWTAFGPANVLAHRVSVEVSLGNAGTAIRHTRSIDLDKLGITERKAVVCVDTARAYTQWRKYDRATAALWTAENLAPQELRIRSSTKDLIRHIQSLAPGSVRHQIDELAARVGVEAV